MLDAYSRRHEAQKIYLRQEAAQRWISWREQVLLGQRPHSGHTSQLSACDAQLRVVSSPLNIFGIKLNEVLLGARRYHRWLHLLWYAVVRLSDGSLDTWGSKFTERSEMGPREAVKWQRTVMAVMLYVRTSVNEHCMEHWEGLLGYTSCISCTGSRRSVWSVCQYWILWSLFGWQSHLYIWTSPGACLNTYNMSISIYTKPYLTPRWILHAFRNHLFLLWTHSAIPPNDKAIPNQVSRVKSVYSMIGNGPAYLYWWPFYQRTNHPGQ